MGLEIHIQNYSMVSAENMNYGVMSCGWRKTFSFTLITLVLFESSVIGMHYFFTNFILIEYVKHEENNIFQLFSFPMSSALARDGISIIIAF